VILIMECIRLVFSLFLGLLIGWQLSIWNCCKPFFSLLHKCQFLCFWRLALSIVVEVFPRPFFRILLLQGCLCLIVCPILGWRLFFLILKYNILIY
jgi:hypothetical protein